MFLYKELSNLELVHWLSANINVVRITCNIIQYTRKLKVKYINIYTLQQLKWVVHATRSENNIIKMLNFHIILNKRLESKFLSILERVITEPKTSNFLKNTLKGRFYKFEQKFNTVWSTNVSEMNG